jgi:hypothetical protein
MLGRFLRLLGFVSLTRDIDRAVTGDPQALLGQVPRALRALKRGQTKAKPSSRSIRW